MLNPRVATVSGPLFVPGPEGLDFASPVLLPNVGLGWCSSRMTVSLDGQLYTGHVYDSFLSSFYGTDFALRLGVGYRLGRNPDAAVKPPEAKR